CLRITTAHQYYVTPTPSIRYNHTLSYSLFFSFNDTATTEIYTLSLHDALPILSAAVGEKRNVVSVGRGAWRRHLPRLMREQHGTPDVRSRVGIEWKTPNVEANPHTRRRYGPGRAMYVGLFIPCI